MIFKLTKRQDSLLTFIKDCHKGQHRKYTNEEYWTHPLAVAEIVSEYYPEGIEAALCHDLFEDTDCTVISLMDKLSDIGYSVKEIELIVLQTLDLTNKYTTKKFPEMNRSLRKSLECQRILSIGMDSQTIKYADIIDNASSIVSKDISFAKLYINEGFDILHVMNKGNASLYKKCLRVLEKENNKLKKHI